MHQDIDRDIAKLGSYFWHLRKNSSWIKRTVETVKVLELGRLERTVSLDIDFDYLANVWRKAGLSRHPSSGILVPVAFLEKGLQYELNLDVDADSTATIAARDLDAAIAVEVLRRFLKEDGVDYNLLPRDVKNQVELVVLRDDYLEDLASEIQDLIATGKQSKSDLSRSRSLRSATNSDAWHMLAQCSFFMTELMTMLGSHMIVAQCKVGGGVSTVKYRYVEAAEISKLPLRARLGWKPLVVDVPHRRAGSSEREHLRVLAPHGIVQDVDVVGLRSQGTRVARSPD